MTMKNAFIQSLIYSPAALVLLFAVSPAASAQTIISANFTGSSSSTDGDPSFLSFNQMAGVVPASNFNNADGFTNGIISDVTDNSGTIVNGLSIAYNASSEGINAATASTPNQDLLNGFIAGNSTAAATTTISGLPSSFGTYDLYVYLADTASTTAAYTYESGTSAQGLFVGTPTTASAQTAMAATSSSGPFTRATATTPGNYLLFSGLSGSTFQLSATAATGQAPINGFQIVSDTPASPAPEPSQVAVLGVAALGLAGLAFRARKRKAAAC